MYSRSLNYSSCSWSANIGACRILRVDVSYKLKSAQACPCIPPLALTAMTTQSGMDVVAQQLDALAAQMGQIRLQGGGQTQANEQLAAQVSRIPDRMDHPFGGNLTGPPQHIVASPL